MRIKIQLESEKDYILLPLHYNHTIQWMLYRNLPEKISEYLHNVGFLYHKRSFKLFTFSKPWTQHYHIDRKTKKIKMKSPISINLSSPIDGLVKMWGEEFIKRETIELGKNQLQLKKIEVIPPPPIDEINTIKTLSPITVYRTFEDVRKFTRYYTPREPEFTEELKKNIQKKFYLITGKELRDFPFEIVGKAKFKSTVLKYKRTIIEGVEGQFQIKAPPEIIATIYDAGLGAKNSQGFGMFYILNSNKRKNRKEVVGG